MSDVLEHAQYIIREEYTRLCEFLDLTPVALDVYIPDIRASGTARTPLGSVVASTDSLYCRQRPRIRLPLTVKPLPDEYLQFPPEIWTKYAWPLWRIKLWHEVIHQVSDDVLGMWDPGEAGRQDPDGAVSERGHGEGWFCAVCLVADKLDVLPEEIERVIFY